MRSRLLSQIGICFVVAGILTSCDAPPAIGNQNKVFAEEVPAETIPPAPATISSPLKPVESPEVSSKTATPYVAPLFWQDMPVIPLISERAREIYRDGIKKGNNVHAFSKVGDCESRTTWFLSDFDLGTDYYSLGEYGQLEDVIEYYRGSFGRLSLVAKPGFTAASVVVPLWADKEMCLKNEHPLACEYRNHHPSVAFIMLGTNDVYRIESFEDNLRKVIDYSIESGVVPILTTKADNLENDHFINAVIGRLAYEYDVPLWNFWAAVQPLSNHGLQEDAVHLTWGPNDFSSPETMLRAWPMRNLTALQVLDAFWREMSR